MTVLPLSRNKTLLHIGGSSSYVDRNVGSSNGVDVGESDNGGSRGNVGLISCVFNSHLQHRSE